MIASSFMVHMERRQVDQGAVTVLQRIVPFACCAPQESRKLIIYSLCFHFLNETASSNELVIISFLRIKSGYALSGSFILIDSDFI